MVVAGQQVGKDALEPPQPPRCYMISNFQPRIYGY